MKHKTKRKKQKSEKRTHFAVTKGGGATYEGFFRQKKRVGTKYCSKIVRSPVLLIYVKKLNYDETKPFGEIAQTKKLYICETNPFHCTNMKAI